MALYPKIDNFSILLDNDCKRMLRRNSKKLIICEVLEKLSNGDKKENLFIDNTKENLFIDNNSHYSHYSDYRYYNDAEKNIFYEIILNIFGCNNNSL